MDVVERLTLDAASEHTLLACQHIHRYELAGALCDGLRVLDLACGSGYGSAILAETAATVHGVDNDAATVDLAAATVGRRTSATFEVADATTFLGDDLSEQFDMIVCFEGLEHLHDVDEAIRRLSEQVARGVQLVASVPNSKAFEEENEFHVVEFGYEEAKSVLDAFPEATMLYQYLAEGSMICADGAQELDARLVHIEQAEPEYANHFVLIANVESSRIEAAHRSRLQLSQAPVYNRYMRNLEMANRELRRRNSELARRLIARPELNTTKTGSAAAAFVLSANQRIAELEAAVTRQAREIGQRDDIVLAQRRELLTIRQELMAPSPAPGRASRTNRQKRKSKRRVSNGATLLEARRPKLPPEGNDWETRKLKAELCAVPWIKRSLPLKERTVLEYGCGSGAISCALGPQVDRLIGVDINVLDVEEGRRRVSDEGLDNVELVQYPVDEILERTRALASDVDVFLFYAVLEHMTIEERLDALAVAQEVVGNEGHIIVCELPNRLIPFDGHTSQMPFFDQLPDELAIRYCRASQREEFVADMDAAMRRGSSGALESLVRWGRGASFHEFELAFGDLRRHVVASNYDELLMPIRSVTREELALARSLESYRPDLAPVWSRYWQDVILSAAPMTTPTHAIRPLPLERVEGSGARLEDGVVEMAPDATARIKLPVRTTRLLIGVIAAVEELELELSTPRESAVMIVPTWRARGDARYATIETNSPFAEAELKLDSPGYLSFLGYEA